MCTWRYRQVENGEYAMSDNPLPPDIFQERLRTARRLRKLEQAELAEKAGLPAASISHFEKGNRKPSFDNLRRLARALDVTTDFLLGTVDEVGLGAAGQTLYRHVENLSDEDRRLAEGIMSLLANKNRQDGGA
jgi:transcriptional regulator with XRE-family HTH domain